MCQSDKHWMGSASTLISGPKTILFYWPTLSNAGYGIMSKDILNCKSQVLKSNSNLVLIWSPRPPIKMISWFAATQQGIWEKSIGSVHHYN